MAAGDPRSVLRITGSLVANPTNLTTPPAFGGQVLGLTTDVVFKPGLRAQELRAEEYGGEPVELLVGSETAVLGALLRGADGDAWSTVFENSTVSTPSGSPRTDYPGTTRAGTYGSTRAIKLLYAPKNTEGHPALLIYKAIPLVEETAELAFSINREFGIPALFWSIRDTDGTNNRVYQLGRLEDLTL